MLNDFILPLPKNVAKQYLVYGSSGFLLVDTGLRNNYTNLSKFLKSKRILLNEIQMVVITHADADHYGCLDLILNASPSTISRSSKIETESIQKGTISRQLKSKGIQKMFVKLLNPLFVTTPASMEKFLSPGEELPYLGGLEVLDSKGHTPGHISLWSKSTLTLFSGDSIVINKHSLSPSSGMNTWNEDWAKISFEKQLELKPARILGGHGIWQQ